MIKMVNHGKSIREFNQEKDKLKGYEPTTTVLKRRDFDKNFYDAKCLYGSIGHCEEQGV